MCKKYTPLIKSSGKVHKTAVNSAELFELIFTAEVNATRKQNLYKIPEWWKATHGEGITLVALDTGIDPGLQDHKDAILKMKDFSQQGIEDLNGHGVHCAEIIAGRQNQTGFSSVAPKSKLLISKVIGNDYSGSPAHAANSIKWAISKVAKITSMPISCPESHPKPFEVIHWALSEGGTILCAAGNEGSLYRNIGYPGRCGNVTTIASYNEYRNSFGFSTEGRGIGSMAPGHKILATYKDGDYCKTPIANNEDMRNHLSTWPNTPATIKTKPVMDR